MQVPKVDLRQSKRNDAWTKSMILLLSGLRLIHQRKPHHAKKYFAKAGHSFLICGDMPMAGIAWGYMASIHLGFKNPMKAIKEYRRLHRYSEK